MTTSTSETLMSWSEMSTSTAAPGASALDHSVSKTTSRFFATHAGLPLCLVGNALAPPARRPDARIAVREYLARGTHRHAELLLKGADIAEGKIGAPDHGNRLTAAVDPIRQHRGQVIRGIDIGRRHGVEDPIGPHQLDERLGERKRAQPRRLHEVREARRHSRRVGRRQHVAIAMAIVAQVDPKGSFDLRRRTGAVDAQAGRRWRDRNAGLSQPVGQRGVGRLGWRKAGRELLRRQPVMIVGRAGALLCREQPVERGPILEPERNRHGEHRFRVGCSEQRRRGQTT